MRELDRGEWRRRRLGNKREDGDDRSVVEGREENTNECFQWMISSH